MPRLKPIPKLKEMALKKVADNIFRYAFIFKDPQAAVLKQSYFVLRKFYSDKLLYLLINTHWDKEKTILQKILSVDYPHSLYENCRELIFNTYLTKLILKSEKTSRKYLQSIPVDFLQTISSTNLTHVYYPYQIRRYDGSMSFFTSLVNVVSLNLKKTMCTDDILFTVWKFCPHIEYLNLSYTNITDRGMLDLCGNFNPVEDDIKPSSHCHNPLVCSERPRLQVLIIKGTNVTNIGLLCALQHLSSIRVFRERILINSQDRFFPHCIPRALFMLHNRELPLTNGTPKFTTNLEELIFCKGDNVENLDLILSMCPKLLVLSFPVAFPTEAFTSLCNCASVTELIIREVDYFPRVPDGLLTFLTARGRQLKSLRFQGLDEEVDVKSLITILSECPNLRHLLLQHFKVLPDEGIRRVFQQFLNQSFGRCSALQNLESFTLCGIDGHQGDVIIFLSEILRNTRAVEKLTIGFFCSFDIDVFLAPALEEHQFPEVRELVLANSIITDELLKSIIVSLKNLRELKYGKFHFQNFLRELERFASQGNFDIEFSAINNEISYVTP